MNVLVCVKRVPAPGERIPLTPDGLELDTRFLGFTIGPHEECAVEEGVRIVEAHGGSSTVLTVGPPEADEQLRFAMAMGIDHGIHVQTNRTDLDPLGTAGAIIEVLAELEAEGTTFDLILFGNETADAGNYQVGTHVAVARGMPIVGGVKGIEISNGTAKLRRGIPGGFELYEVPLPAAVAVKEGINLPRYPTMRGRLKAKKTDVRTFVPTVRGGAFHKLRLRNTPQPETDTVLLGNGHSAAPRVADVLEELGLL